jgi:hypothetical protein
VTVLVLDEMGEVSIAESGNRFPALNPYVPDLPAGLTCRQLLDPDGEFGRGDNGLNEAQRYFAIVVYWLEQGRPTALTDQHPDRPCQSQFPRQAVEQVWSGGWIAPTASDQ